MKQILQWISLRPKTVITLCLTFFALLSAGIVKTQTNFGVKFWFTEEDRPLQALERFEKDFGEDNNIIAVIHEPSGLLNNQGMSLLKKIGQAMEQTAGVRGIQSLAAYPTVKNARGEIVFQSFSDAYAGGSSLKELIAQNPETQGWLINRSHDTAFVIGKLAPQFEKAPDYQKLVRDVKKGLAGVQKPKSTVIELTGLAAIIDQFRDSAFKDLYFALPLLALAMFALMFYHYKSLYLALLPFLVFNLSALATFGFAGWMAFPFHNVSSVIAGALITLAFADVMHLLNTARQKMALNFSFKEALSESAKKNFTPTILTSITTALGFLSFAAADLAPLRQIGIMAGLGSLLLWLACYGVLLPLLFSLPPKNIKHAPNIFDRIPVKAPKAITITVFASLALVSLFYLTKLEVNTNPENYFSENTGVARAKTLIAKTLKGKPGAELVIDSGSADGIVDPKLMKKIERLRLDLLAIEGIHTTQTPLPVLNKANQALEGKNVALPEDKSKLAQLFFFTELNALESFNLSDSMDLAKRKMKLTLFWDADNTRKALSLAKMARKSAEDLGLKASVTGKSLLYFQMTDYVFSSFLSSLALSLCMVFFVFLLMLRNLKKALICLLPNVFSVLIGLGALGFLAVPIDMTVCLAAAVCLGLAVDDTIHLIHRMEKNPGQGLLETAPTLALTSFSLILGFGAFAFSDFLPNRAFGLLAGWIILWAFFTDIYLLPLLIGPRKAKNNDNGTKNTGSHPSMAN